MSFWAILARDATTRLGDLVHRLTLQIRLHIPDGDIDESRAGLFAGPGDMRGEGEIFRSKERISGQDGLRRGNIAGSTCDTVGVMRKSVDFIFARESAEIIP